MESTMLLNFRNVCGVYSKFVFGFARYQCEDGYYFSPQRWISMGVVCTADGTYTPRISSLFCLRMSIKTLLCFVDAMQAIFESDDAQRLKLI